MSPPPSGEDKRHSENLRRFEAIEEKVDGLEGKVDKLLGEMKIVLLVLVAGGVLNHFLQ